MTTTAEGVENTEVSGALNTEADATNAFLNQWTDKDATAKELSEKDTGKKPKQETPAQEETAPEGDTEGTEGSEETPETKGDEEDAPKKKYADDDETYVKIKEGDTEHEVSVKDLKRLFGQEAALTRKSQEVADLRKKADTETAKALASLQTMVKRAQERADPYKKIDFLVASKELSAEDLSALRQEAQRVLEDERFLTSELDGFVKQVQENVKAETVKQAVECVKTLKDAASPLHIPGWGDDNNKVYNEVRAFAREVGVAQEVIDGVTDPAVIKIVHMAMLFKRGQSKVVTEKVNKTPKKIIKTSKTVQPTDVGGKPDQKKSMDKLRQTGTTDAAAEAFLARWKPSDDE